MSRALSVGLFILSACNPSGSGPSNEVDSSALPVINSVSLKRELVQVKGSAADFGILSFVAISCAGYEGQFSDAAPFLITDKVKLTAISNRLASLQPDKRGFGLDVRAKAILLYNDQTSDTLCMGKFNSYYGGRIVSTDQKLYQLLGVKTE